jgi:hypothetical protein
VRLPPRLGTRARVRDALDLEETVFAQPIRIEASASALLSSRAQFRRGADLLVHDPQPRRLLAAAVAVAGDRLDFLFPSPYLR